MKILIVVPDTEVGGVTTSAVNFSNELTYRGHEVLFLDMSGENACADRLNEKVGLPSLKGKSTLWNISAQSVKNAHGIKKIGILALGAIKKLTIRSGLWYKLIFSKFSKDESFDVAIAFRQCAPCYSFILNKVNAKKKIGFVHGDVNYLGDISSWKKYMTRFDKIAYVSNAVKDGFVEFYPELAKNACTVYNMFNREQILRMSDESSPVLFDKSIKNIVTVARIEDSQKQICWIPHVAKILKEKSSPDFKWYIVGNGPDFDKNVQLTKELNVDDVLVFVGALSNPFSLVTKADFVVLPTKWEAYPMVVIESFILKKPLISTNYCSVREALTEGNHGYIAEQSVESVADLVLGMIRNDNEMYSRCIEFFKKYEYTNDIPYAQFLDAIGD